MPQAAYRTGTPDAGDVGMVTRVAGTVPISGSITAIPEKSTITTRTSVAVSLISVALVPANASRKGYSVYNTSTTSTLFLAQGGAAASLTTESVEVRPGAYFECPFNFVGDVWGIWNIADGVGAARITEYT